jgi:hypothetical protein
MFTVEDDSRLTESDVSVTLTLAVYVGLAILAVAVSAKLTRLAWRRLARHRQQHDHGDDRQQAEHPRCQGAQTGQERPLGSRV